MVCYTWEYLIKLLSQTFARYAIKKVEICNYLFFVFSVAWKFGTHDISCLVFDEMETEFGLQLRFLSKGYDKKNESIFFVGICFVCRSLVFTVKSSSFRNERLILIALKNEANCKFTSFQTCAFLFAYLSWNIIKIFIYIMILILSLCFYIYIDIWYTPPVLYLSFRNFVQPPYPCRNRYPYGPYLYPYSTALHHFLHSYW